MLKTILRGVKTFNFTVKKQKMTIYGAPVSVDEFAKGFVFVGWPV